ncbi:hypothetical protein [Myroides odoratus]|uniref:Uncharacterized protein n=1 Tax=Myroides odoratus TaxID=256 RepID=A0A9Q7E721_MYROD|nr:hypothetical protein [Myroides odoratus]EHQ41494.1 hypothetical protein Myrod_0658 [Myroides odoratus DSM 2801]EKB02713.1 hypothetical protein HMPREF9716_03742 [Myroides odoratus CIP 103059]QQT98920.1 hypothetical protein I6I88_11915 [Myroides odoratus]WQD58895.1 hypothetical protein U0010_07060 [Myroides odoratus]STZ28757.1 Uncharacterised protein [Myroides odoratus]
MAQNIIDTQVEKIELLTYVQVCELMKIKATTFYRFYNNKLTAYKNAERPEDKKKYYNKKEVVALIESRKKTPTKVVVARKAVDND